MYCFYLQKQGVQGPCGSLFCIRNNLMIIKIFVTHQKPSAESYLVLDNTLKSVLDHLHYICLELEISCAFLKLRVQGPCTLLERTRNYSYGLIFYVPHH
jgi:hypothetical protein